MADCSLFVEKISSSNRSFCHLGVITRFGVEGEWQVRSLEDDRIKELSSDHILRFRQQLVTFVAVLKGVLKQLDTVCDSQLVKSNSNQPAETTMVMVEGDPSPSITTDNCSSMETDHPDQHNGNAFTNTAPEVDSKLVQIKASKSEIERRIAAFIERKQTEVDEINRREFCSAFVVSQEDQCPEGCARTDAVFIPRAGSRSHVKVSRVVNAHGPQTVTSTSPARSFAAHVKTEPPDQTLAVEERMCNLEQHLQLTPDTGSTSDTFCRLRNLENRILYLESLSPEYFSPLNLPSVRRQDPDSLPHKTSKSGEMSQRYQNLSVDEIELRMNELKSRLLSRMDR